MQKKPPNAFVTVCLSSPLVILLIFPPQYLICPFSIAWIISMLIYQCLFDFCCSLYVFYKFQSKLVRVDLPLVRNQKNRCGLGRLYSRIWGMETENTIMRLLTTAATAKAMNANTPMTYKS